MLLNMVKKYMKVYNFHIFVYILFYSINLFCYKRYKNNNITFNFWYSYITIVVLYIWYLTQQS